MSRAGVAGVEDKGVVGSWVVGEQETCDLLPSRRSGNGADDVDDAFDTRLAIASLELGVVLKAQVDLESKTGEV